MPTDERISRVIAWSVHLFTASGAVLGTFSLFETASGRFDRAILLMLAALAVDAVDGTLARAARVSERVPVIDGRRLDDIVDYLNFVIVPVFFMASVSAVLHPAWLAAPVLASCYGFARTDAKTADDFFLGFPSYWNILAIYLWLLETSALGGTLWVVGLSLAVFLPLKYLYPSKIEPFWLRVTMGLAALLWTVSLAACVLSAELRRAHVAEWSLIFPAWYMILSALRGGWLRGRRARVRRFP